MEIPSLWVLFTQLHIKHIKMMYPIFRFGEMKTKISKTSFCLTINIKQYLIYRAYQECLFQALFLWILMFGFIEYRVVNIYIHL